MKFTIALTVLSVIAAASAQACTGSFAQLEDPAARALVASPAVVGAECFANRALSKAAETSFNLATV
ncbi:hypothetical protein HYFRA_00012866 [Hymenoscyphus fraxineus]|uniref:Uncharacterized protein n=1 Tax=Hymenoscyphus fraxineus TaxID=746836 RepID=A0A9N9L7E8_9HELO|nr:hypothetical protein HYFRA_00012866 [Hymenoscyphus fraxineus]